MTTEKLTDEEKARFAPMLHATWQAIGPDASQIISGRDRVGQIVEMTCDANRPETFGGMSGEDYRRLCDAYSLRSTQTWLRKVLNY